MKDTKKWKNQTSTQVSSFSFHCQLYEREHVSVMEVFVEEYEDP
jgi:hypothetical protein